MYSGTGEREEMCGELLEAGAWGRHCLSVGAERGLEFDRAAMNTIELASISGEREEDILGGVRIPSR